ncbi:MAG: nucleoid-associated protein, YbaB/EbfC family [Clostridiales bacterium GWF2_38_85]|nr:MAG: nucleoid-associated protein, YbaB/EbfC family [Clostridiales bacterium GWF2_38_85]HBL83601.1 YbaB/EbfC family nucleoid-associated protein [Clostridiales bacterium]
MKVRLPQGMGGNPGNMNSMIKQAQKMQDDMATLQAELDTREYNISAGGGMVKITILGTKEVTKFEISPALLGEDEVEDLQDILVAAVNEAIKTVESTNQQELSKLTGNISMPGLF